MEFSTIIEAIAYYADSSPNKICLIEAKTGYQCTYSELWLWSCAFSKRLRALGIKKGDRVVVRTNGLLETYTAQFGIYLAGGVYCPVEQHMKELRMIEMLEYLDSDILISSERIAYDCQWIALSSVIDKYAVDESANGEIVLPSADDLCIIPFSTGTTGKAKGIMHSFYTNANNFTSIRKELNYIESDIFLWVQGFDRPTSYTLLYAALSAGATGVHHPGVVFIKDFFKTLKKYAVSTMYIQSFAAAIILKADPNEISQYANQLRLISIGGGALPEEHKNMLAALLPNTNLFVQYPSTENTMISCYKFNGLLGKPNCVGKPISGTRVYLLDDDGNEIRNTSKDNLGCIAVESPNNMLGYWNDPEQTARALNGSRLIMTDMGYMDNEGYLYLYGRRDDVIVTGGYKVAPYEIEDIAIQIEGVEECVCIAYPDSMMVNIPKLFVKMKGGYIFSERNIREYLTTRLETFKLPRIICEIDDFPRVGNTLKIDRNELRNDK